MEKEVLIKLEEEKETLMEEEGASFALMEDDFANYAGRGSMKKTNLVGEDDGLGALRDGGKDCRVDDEALDLDDSRLMRENEDSNGVRD
ncbi:uncharacterized protein HKW66_Vig0236610 [Vigna angularis]|uniref:Uncharacterized protein n=1 Tax=Phaseolus angularis TaxID=3914 RepID=A0A8T0KRX8_PHAAN|nr:uncharacterized protein HKW66_Vig0236610 [Vigna angularis]